MYLIEDINNIYILLKTNAVMTYTKSNTAARRSFSFRSKTITKHGEMKNFFWLLYLKSVLVITTILPTIPIAKSMITL